MYKITILCDSRERDTHSDVWLGNLKFWDHCIIVFIQYRICFHWQVLHEENTRLATELKAYEERTSGEGQETPTKPQGAPIVEEPKKEENALQQQSEYDHK